MMPYIRLYTSLIGDLDFLGLDLETRCLWYETLLFATEKGGFTPSLRAMARVWGKTTEEVEAMLYPLVRRGWLIVTEDCIEVTGWQDRQPAPKNEDNARRQREHRERMKALVGAAKASVTVTECDSNALRNASVTQPECDSNGRRGGEGTGSEGTGVLPPNGGLSGPPGPDPEPPRKMAGKKGNKKAVPHTVSEEMRTIFDLWKELFRHPDAKFTEERQTHVHARLVAYGLEACIRSILGYRIDDWDERVSGGLRTNDLCVLFANGSKLEKGLELYRADEADALKRCPPHLAVRVALSWRELVRSGRVQEGIKVSPELWAVFSGERTSDGYAPDMPEILTRVMRQQLEGDLAPTTPEEAAIIARLRSSQNG